MSAEIQTTTAVIDRRSRNATGFSQEKKLSAA
jgi:hypothetical protein